ncbi:glycosyl hydrolase family 28-related protein [Arthrobacter globiformis]|uniref:glycoside hydrolase family 55 protein n=1 Tax=Arthrobacter globiformis TaxID=1665 RepID=UPI0039782879
MANEVGKEDRSASRRNRAVERRGLFRIGTLITAFTGASAISAVGATSAQAAPIDASALEAYVPIAEKGAASGVAALDLEAKVPFSQLPDLSATIATRIEEAATDPTGVLPATFAPLTLYGKAAVRKDELVFNVRDYGAKGDGTTNDAAAFQAAISSAFAAGGGIVYASAGTYMLGSTLKFPMNPTTRYCNVTLAGAGPNSTIIRRTGNFVLLDISGTDTAHWIIGVAVQNLKIVGGGNPAWTASVVRSYYSQFLSFTRVNWENSRATALDCVQIFDSYFYECRWDYQGIESPNSWTIWIKCSDQGAATGWGSSTNSSNNCWFINCVMEQCRGGGVYLDGRASDGTSLGSCQINRIYFINWKYENAVGSVAASSMKMLNCNHVVWQNGHASTRTLSSAAIGTVNLVEIKDTLSSQISNVSLNPLTGASPTSVRTGVSYQGGNSLGSLVNVDSSSQRDHSPSLALVEYTGSNILMSEERTGYYYNPANAPLFSGSPTTLVRPRRSLAKNNGFLAWAYDIAMLSGSTQILTSGTMVLAKIPVDDLMTVNAVNVLTSVAGSGLTGAYAALYTSTGYLLGMSADASAALAGAPGLKTLALTPQANKPLTIAAGDGVYVYAALVATGRTPPTLHRTGSVAPNANLTAAGGLRFANGPIGITKPPTTILLSSFKSSNPVWMAVS